MTVTFCGHGRINRPEGLSSWLDMILPSLIEGGAAKTLEFSKRKQKVIFQFLYQKSDGPGTEENG